MQEISKESIEFQISCLEEEMIRERNYILAFKKNELYLWVLQYEQSQW